MLLFILIISVFHQPGGAVVDGMTMGFVRNNQQYSYGQFRLWGSAGWAVFSLLTGYIAAKNTHNIFYFGLISFSLLSLFNLLTLPEKPLKNRSLVNFRSFAVFFNNGRLMVFLLLILFSGIAVSPLHQFINLYYKDIGASNSFLGWVFFVQAIIEIPTFLLGVWLLRRSNPEVVILVSLLISGIRMFCYSFISDPLIAISFSAFHGITIAFFLIAVVEYVQSHTPDHLRTTGQALIWAFHYGAGVTFGNLILGYVRDHSDMLAAMRLHAIITAFVLIASALFFSLTSLKKKP
jgi:PPP family 3-phenylpropionic acid transporter